MFRYTAILAFDSGLLISSKAICVFSNRPLSYSASTRKQFHATGHEFDSCKM